MHIHLNVVHLHLNVEQAGTHDGGGDIADCRDPGQYAGRIYMNHISSPRTDAYIYTYIYIYIYIHIYIYTYIYIYISRRAFKL
jgi:hypothetical protein